ncbi:hypothetical protein [Pseudonocardia lacus]|uniref:hypothetical protein n=1 Tax=Pseudonocardia lacus TaxID=2835865 RepID=UPI001BDD1E7B|nr:hypothetical protein [Pseudonocardia lacus]
MDDQLVDDQDDGRSDPAAPAGPPTIDTPAVRTARQLLDDHLRARPVAAGALVPGSVIGLSGPPGAGKTHLARLLAAQTNEFGPGESGIPARAVHLNVAGMDADQLHAAFVGALPRSEVVACVRGYHADLVSGAITDEQVAARTNEFLRTPDQTATERDAHLTELGLSPAVLLERLSTILVEVVGDSDYAAALVLLLRDGLDTAAWAWLRGEPPAGVLRERGITAPAPGGLDALGVFARLYGRQGARLVLLLDDVDQLDFDPGHDRQVRALRRALEQLRVAGTLVYLTGSAEALDELEIGPYRRTGTRIELTGFDGAAAARFLRARSGSGTLSPFSADAVERIVDLTDGNPRMLGDFTDRLRREAAQTGREVTEDRVLDDARSWFAVADRSRVVATIRRVLENHLWDFRVDHVASIDDGGRLDFWIPVAGPEQAGVGILIADAVVDPADVQRLVATSETLDRHSVRAQVQVVVTGAASAVHAARIQQAFGRAPLSFASETFDDDLAAAVKTMLHAFDDADDADPIAGLRDWIDRIDRQQTRTLDLVDRVAAGVDSLRGQQPPPGWTGEARRPSARGADDPLPQPVRTVFARAVDDIVALGSPEGTGRGLFLADDRGQEVLAGLRRIGRVDHLAMRALGTVSMVLAVVQEFRSAVREWARTVDREWALVPASPGRRELDRLCARYEEAVDVLPLLELHNLPRPARRGGSGRIRPARVEIDAANRQIRDLGRAVREAAERSPIT